MSQRIMAEQPAGAYWVKQNPELQGDWATLAKAGHVIYHLMDRAYSALGKVMINGTQYTYPEAQSKFLGPA